MKLRVVDWIEIALVTAVLVWSIFATWIIYTGIVNGVELAVEKAVDEIVVAVREEVVAEQKSEVEVETEDVYIPKLYTEEDAIALAKMVWGEARGVIDMDGVSGDCQRAATVWVVLNRYDAGFGDSIFEVVTAPHQFHGYDENYPVEPDMLNLVCDVLDRWNAEKNGGVDVGRVLPADYLWFHGDGKNNWFRDEYRGADGYWDWQWGDPYAA